MAVEVEDDVFFADLSKQISLLIMDDEEEFPVQYQHLIIGQGCPQEHPYMQQTMMPQPYGFEVPYGREGSSKGTGVFIPRSSAAPRRKNRSRRSAQAADGSSASHSCRTPQADGSQFCSCGYFTGQRVPLQRLPAALWQVDQEANVGLSGGLTLL